MLTQTKARSGALQGGRVVFLPLSSIRPNPAQPRTVFDAQGLQELAASIRAELLDAEAEINEVYCRANASLVKYSKAGKFRVINDEEIPRFHPGFSARKFAETLGIDKEVFE